MSYGHTMSSVPDEIETLTKFTEYGIKKLLLIVCAFPVKIGAGLMVRELSGNSIAYVVVETLVKAG